MACLKEKELKRSIQGIEHAEKHFRNQYEFGHSEALSDLKFLKISLLVRFKASRCVFCPKFPSADK